MVTEGSRVADVGCDHGYLSIWLFNSGKCPSCIAMDIHAGPLAAAEKNVRAYGASAGVQLRLSDGLAGLEKGEADCILIAGMGGSLITQILKKDSPVLEGVRELVLEPQSDAALVRRFVAASGFGIVQEDLVTECGKTYPVIHAVRERMKEPHAASESHPAEAVLTDTELRYGPCLLRDRNPRLKTYLEKEKKRLTAIMARLRRIQDEEGQDKNGQDKNGQDKNGQNEGLQVRIVQIQKELEQIHEAEQYF